MANRALTSRRKVVAAGRLCGETDATCEQPVSSTDSLALISTRSGTKLENTSLSVGGLKCLFQKLVARIWLFVLVTEDTLRRLHSCTKDIKTLIMNNIYIPLLKWWS